MCRAMAVTVTLPVPARISRAVNWRTGRDI
jgi:hypothetical protein